VIDIFNEMGALRYAGLAIVAAVIGFRLLNNPTVGTLVYISISSLFDFDSDVVPYRNFDGEIEDGKFLHRFTHVNATATGVPANITYHSVECGSPDAEPIIFLHGLAETWIVWKDVMLPFCETHRPIAIDIEGMGQSYWPNVLDDLKGMNSREFYGNLQLALFIELGAERFNLVVSDYGFWTSMNILLSKTADGKNRVLRYGKFQSTVGVDDIDRIPQGVMLFYVPKVMNTVLNANPHALARILMGKALIPFPSAHANQRVGLKPIPDDVFHRYILRGIHKVSISSFLHFLYSYI
jgi:pimeloyl-ACP methyl ester carboxylesterase